MAPTIRIAMLNADTPVPNVLNTRGSYGAIFTNLLTAAARRLSRHITVEAADFDVVRGEYPSSPAGFDALLVTGSSASSYDDVPWTHRLDRYLRDVYRDHPHVRIFGSCFGHQIVCQSLLRENGARVEKDPKGWELGVHEIQLTDTFSKALGGKSKTEPISSDRLPTPDTEEDSTPKQTLRLQFIHADHVKLEAPALPPSWIPIGSSKHCTVQGVYQPGRVLTYQGHFEFDRFVNTETVKVFGAKWEPSALQAALDSMDKDDDSQAAADIVVRFLLEANGLAEKGDGGLLTPPLKA